MLKAQLMDHEKGAQEEEEEKKENPNPVEVDNKAVDNTSNEGLASDGEDIENYETTEVNSSTSSLPARK